jgi:hypothetical protein
VTADRTCAPRSATRSAHVIDGVVGDRLAADLHQLRADGVAHLAITPRPGAIADRALDVVHEYRRGRGLRCSPGVLALDRLFGGPSPLHGDLLSHLLFDRAFTEALIDLGRSDARAALAARGGDPWATPGAAVSAAARGDGRPG